MVRELWSSVNMKRILGRSSALPCVARLRHKAPKHKGVKDRIADKRYGFFMRGKVKLGIRNEKYEIFGNIGLGGNVQLRHPHPSPLPRGKGESKE